MKSLMIAGFAVSLVAGVLFGRSADAQASARSFNGGGCRALTTTGAAGDSNIKMPAYQMYNDSTLNAVDLICPVQSDTTISARAATRGLEVYGYANGAYVDLGTTGIGNVKGCRTYADGSGAGGACGQAKNSSASGVQTFSFATADLAGWGSSTDNDSYFVTMRLMQKTGGGSANVIFGYKMTN